jgi:hypothetical protein
MNLKKKLKLAVLLGFMSGLITALNLNCDRDPTEEAPHGPTDPGPDPEDPKDPSDPSDPDPEDPTDPEDPQDPGDPGEAFRFCLTGDTGEGNSDQKAVADALIADGCQAMVIAGDVIYSSGINSSTDSQLTSKFFKPYEALLERMPIYLTLGNHDYRGSTQPWLEVAEKNPAKIIYPNMWYSAQVAQGLCFFGLDSNASQKVQLEWILEQIPKVKGACKFSIAAMHHPYRSSGHHASEEPGKNKDLYEKAVLGHFDLAFAGHEHHGEDAAEINGTRMLIFGGGGTSLRDVEPKYGWGESIHGYLRLDVVGNVGNFEFRKVDGSSVSTVHKGVIQGKGLR